MTETDAGRIVKGFLSTVFDRAWAEIILNADVGESAAKRARAKVDGRTQNHKGGASRRYTYTVREKAWVLQHYNDLVAEHQA